MKVLEDGQVLIHFDGWTSRYDYITETTDLDLHPLGWMIHVGHDKPGLNTELQKPKSKLNVNTLANPNMSI